MSEHKLILSESELVDLITSTVLDIQEQRIGYSYKDITLFERRLQEQHPDGSETGFGKAAKDALVGGAEFVFDTAPDAIGDWWEKLKSLYDPGSEDSYHHGINQSLAILLYGAGALFCFFGKTPQTKTLCVELEVLALLIEMIDFQQYMEEDDYYNAGLVAAFVWFPIGRLSVKGLKTLFPKVFQKAVNKFIKAKDTPSALFDYLIRTQGQKFVGKLAQVIKKYPGLIKSLESAKKKVMDTWKGLYKVIKNPPWWLPNKMVKGLTNVILYILKPLYKTIKFLIVILGSISAYDPAIIAPLFGWAGRKWDITLFTNVEDWLEGLAEDDIGAVHIWNKALSVAGSVPGVVTTTRIDCDLDFYTWDDVVEAFKKHPAHLHQIRTHGKKKDGINLTSLWEEWQKGWRPDIEIDFMDFSAATDAALDKKLKEKIKQTYKLSLWSDMKKLEQHKDWFLEGGLEVEEWEDFADALKTCKDWLKFIKTERSKELVPLIMTMSDSPNFPGDK